MTISRRRAPPTATREPAVRDDGCGPRLPSRRRRAACSCARRGRAHHAQLRESSTRSAAAVFKRRIRGPPGGTATILPERRAHLDQRALGRRDARHRHAGIGRGGRCVLSRGRDWRAGRFVVQDWYLAAYTPIRDFSGATVGMLYVGVLERGRSPTACGAPAGVPGIGQAGVALVYWFSVRVARRILRAIHAWLSPPAHRPGRLLRAVDGEGRRTRIPGAPASIR